MPRRVSRPAQQRRRLDDVVAAAPRQTDRIIDNQQQGEGEQQGEGGVSPIHPPEQKTLDAHGQQGHPEGRRQEPGPEGQPPLPHQGQQQVSSQHVERAVGEIEDAEHAEDDGQARGDDKQQDTEVDAVEKGGNESTHGTVSDSETPRFSAVRMGI